MDIKRNIAGGKTSLGIELGSSRIKAVLIGNNYEALASGSSSWESRPENGVWTYRLDEVWEGIRAAFRDLAEQVLRRYGTALASAGAAGISAMMHGYLVFGKNGNLLTPFRSWRNSMTEKAAAELTRLFNFNIPQRWSIAHLYQAFLSGEPHVKDIAFMTTLAGYVHWKLTGRKVIGLGDASGMFPVSGSLCAFDPAMLKKFNALLSPYAFGRETESILPAVLPAGENAGFLTEEGAKLLDPSRTLKAGIPFCPPEGDAAAGMIATNTIARDSGSVSAGTSIFALVTSGKKLSRVYPEIGTLSSPEGKTVALAQCNNGTGDLDAWVKVFGEAASLAGSKIGKQELYDALYNKAPEGDAGTEGLLAYNYYAGEQLSGMKEGRPLFTRHPGAGFTLAGFMKTLLFSCLASIKYGIDILTGEEKLHISRLVGHGGFFKTPGIGQRYMAAAFNTPVSVMEEYSSEGGAWGIALLAAYMRSGGGGLEKFLDEKVFAGKKISTLAPRAKDVDEFGKFMERYTRGLAIERAAIRHFR